MSMNKQFWATRMGLILAVAGNAVGLGNFLRFPAQAAQNGGGAFIIPYLICFVIMGLPLLWMEWAIGRHGGQRGFHTTPGMLDGLGRKKWLKYIGVFGMFNTIVVAAYYCYVEAWTLAYVWHCAIGTFQSVSGSDFFSQLLDTKNSAVLATPREGLFWFLLTIAINALILSRGISEGVERVAKVGMPLLVIFGAILAVRVLCFTNIGDPHVVESPLNGLGFIWQPNLQGLLNPSIWLAAAGQIFFTLSVSMGTIQCYASYLGKKDDIALNAATAGWMNGFIEVVLGSAIIIPIATAYIGLSGVQAATTGGSGFALGFMTIPTLFNNWGAFAQLAGVLWFGLLFIAGLTSSLAMGQPILSFLQDEWKVSNAKGALVFVGICALVGSLAVFFYPAGVFDEYDYWSGTIGLVLFGMLQAYIFVFVFGMKNGWREIVRGADMQLPKAFYFIMKYITPHFILLVMLSALIKPEGNWLQAWQQLWGDGSWPFAADSVIGKLLHLGEGSPVRQQIANATRLLLVLLLIALCYLVHVTWKRKGKHS